MKKLAIVSGKGGIGKTTLAMNLAYLLHNKYNVDSAVVDCNLTTPHLSVSLGYYDNNRTLNRVLTGHTPLEEAIVEHPVGLKVLPASNDIKDLEGVDINLLRSAIQNASTNLILDSAPGIGREGLASIQAADEILFVTHPHRSAVEDIRRCSKVAEMLDKKVLGVVVNCRKGLKHEMTREEIEAITETPVLTEIPYDLDIEKSVSARLPLDVYKHTSKANESFYKICSELTGIPYRKPRTVFGRLFWKIGLRK
ncbi:MAG: P-loop NTPase [Candidatus Aenigmarchaeota archaeon]|nr:P-loop NTPase [Candidatus Aenigmarchaeota archaeon]